MSFEAIRWALSQPVDRSSAKFVLVAMADCVNAEAGTAMLCWPSTQHLAERTCQDRKTVLDGLHRLREAGFIVDTGERRGGTGQVPVYLLKTPENGTASLQPPAKPAAPKSTENGTAPKTGPVPKTDANSTENGHEQSRFSSSTVPKTGHGTRKEPGNIQEGTRKGSFDASAIDLPEWLDREDWQGWVDDRRARRKPITERGAREQIKLLADYRGQGHAPASVIANSIANGYQGLFPPKRAPASGFAEPAWRAEQRRRAQQAAPGVAEKSAVQFFLDVEARDVQDPRIDQNQNVSNLVRSA